MMSKTIVRTYDSVEALANVEEDLLATGIEQEQILVDKRNKQVKVVVPAAAEPEIVEILDRHRPVGQ